MSLYQDHNRVTSELAAFNPAKAPGGGYAAEVPDTIDLAERAGLGLQGIAGTTDPDCYYQMWFTTVYGSREPYLAHAGADGTCTPKYAESFAMLRTASGSPESLDIETMQMAHLLANISPDDGLYYSVWKPDRPWHSFYYDAQQEDYCSVVGAGRMMRAMMTWQERDGDSRWDDRLRAMARGLAKIAIYRDDYAYYPDGGHSHQFAYPKSGWRHTREPESDAESAEGSVMDSIGHVIYALARWYRRSADREALELSRKLANFLLLPKMWGGLAEEVGVKGAEQGHCHAHPHGHMVGLRGLLEYGRTVHDVRVLEFVRRGYEYLRTYMIPRIGWLPGNGIGDGSIHAEGCNLGDLVALGIRLSDAGAGDYWEDVDAVVRNLLMEQQLVDVEKLRAVAANSPRRGERGQLPGQEMYDGMPERIIGTYASFASPNSLPPASIMGCCTGNATQGLYYAWEGALRCDGDQARVNLLVNRVSRLVDVDSYLPYQGKVVVRNKMARQVAVRILSWIDRSTLKATVAGREVPLSWIGNYVEFADLRPSDTIELTFSMPESKASYTANHRVWRREGVYTYNFRGSTVLDVAPKSSAPQYMPIYNRNHMRANETPMKRVVSYVPDRVILDW